MAGREQTPAEKKADDKDLDDALKDTFPASDPIVQQNPTEVKPRPKQPGQDAPKPPH